MKSKVFDIQLLKRLLKYAKPYRIIFNSVIIFAILLSVFSALRPYLLKKTVDSYLIINNKSGLLLYIILMGIVLLVEVCSNFFFIYWANRLGQDLVKDIRIKLFGHLLKFRIKYFDTTPVGQLVTRSVSDIESIARIFSQGLFMILSDLMKMLVIILLMFYMNWHLTCIVIIAIPILVYVTKIFQTKMQIAFEEVRNQIASLNTFVQERVTGMKIVQLFNRENIEYEKFKEINEKHKKAWIKTIFYNSIFFPIADIISSVTLGFIVLYGGIQITNGNLFTSFGDLFSYAMFIGLLFNPLRQIADKFNEMQQGMIAASRVFAILDTEDEIQKEGNIEAPNFSGNIRFDNVYFSYVPGEYVLKDLSFEAPAGKTVAIVGATGAGKSTIINLLNRFYEIDKGAIYIDNHNIEKYTISSVRKQIAVVLQDVFLFSDTIFNNISLYNPDISEEQIIDASKKIGIHDFIMQLPGNYNFNVRERGRMLSSGQRQLIAFLRAYISNPSILVLDEATSSVDSYSEELIQRATATITKDRTSIIIAHRLTTIVNADCILVMNKGKILEQGNHQQLLEKTDGVYRKLYQSQFENTKLLI